MKIAAYTCALNEEQFVERWANSVKDADQLLVLDTGSNDHTVTALRDFQVDVRSAQVRPWRFDDAKNVALFSLDPDVDVAVQVDMDEVLSEGWRARLEEAWKPGTTRLKYMYVWSWLESGRPDKIFYTDKIGGRFTHRWRGPVHEILVPTVPETISICEHVLIEHYPDQTKTRQGYLDLLRLGVEEDPFNDRHAHYYARELFFNGQWQPAMTQFQRHLQLPTSKWLPERAASLRYVARCHEKLNNPAAAYNCYTLATLEDPLSREAHIDLAEFLLRQGEWTGVVYYCQKASNISTEMPSYISERYAREEGAYDLASVALYRMGQVGLSRDFAIRALQFNPNDERLQRNVRELTEETDATSQTY